jgi:capsular polysaccharide biosynthesis protein
MDIGQHFRIIWRRRVPILLLSLLIAGLVYLWSSNQTKTYQAASQVNVTAANTGPNPEQSALLAARTYAQLATSTPVLQEAIRTADLPMNVNQLRGKLTVGPSSSVPLITITSKGRSTAQAIEMNAAVGNALVDKVEGDQKAELEAKLASLESELAKAREDYDNAEGADKQIQGTVLTNLLAQKTSLQTDDVDRLEVLGVPFARARPIRPKPARDTLLAFVLALIVNAELVVGLTALGDRFSSERDVARLLAERGIPILGRIPSSRSRPDLLDAFRELRTNLIVHQETPERLRIAVTGVEPRAGKTFVSVHAAQSLADLGF